MFKTLNAIPFFLIFDGFETLFTLRTLRAPIILEKIPLSHDFLVAHATHTRKSWGDGGYILPPIFDQGGWPI